ncbi:MAG TPA: two-component regulator propeller domain-containing protein, partial [Saprospiraceae bacterium]
ELKGDTVNELGKHLMLIYQDRKNTYWFGSWGEGLYRYDGKTILHYTTKHGLCQNKIVQILEDNDGNLYFNTDIGISKFDGQRFTTLRLNSNSTEEWKLEPDDLWFKGAQDSGVVYRYDGQTLHRLIFPNIKIADEYIAAHPRSKYPNMVFSPYDVYTIYKDTDGNVWFGSGVLGVCRFNGQTIDWITEEDVKEMHDGPANGVRSIIEDKEGKFWFNTLFRYTISKDKGKFSYTREKGIGNLDGDPGSNLNEYLSIAKDKHDDLWIVTYNDGVWRYGGGKIIHYSVKVGDKDITLFSIYKDNQGDLWLGTHDYGVYKFNGTSFQRLKMN